MFSALFWNLAKNEKVLPSLGRLAKAHSIDVFFLAECPENVGSIPSILNAAEHGIYKSADHVHGIVRAYSRLPKESFYQHEDIDDASFYRLCDGVDGRRTRLHIVAVHLPSKMGMSTHGQQARATKFVVEIAEFENRETLDIQDTVVVGDLNMNPFDPGMVVDAAFHAAMTKKIARKTEKKVGDERYRRFYNPMWGLFGDRTSGPAGTFYWKSSEPSNHHWQMFDQILLRPSLADKLVELRILDSDGEKSLINRNGIPTREHLSDHLPLFFELDV